MCSLGTATPKKNVQVLRRNDIEMGAGDASFLATRFGRGGGSQVRVRACSHGFRWREMQISH